MRNDNCKNGDLDANPNQGFLIVTQITSVASKSPGSVYKLPVLISKLAFIGVQPSSLYIYIKSNENKYYIMIAEFNI